MHKLQRGVAFHRAGNLDEAARLYSCVLDTDPHNADACHLLGLIHEAWGKNEKARSLLERSVALKPTELLFLRDLAMICLNSNDTRRARELFSDILQRYPKNLDAAAGLGTVYHRNGQWSDAAALFERAVALDPQNPGALNNLGAVYKQMGDLHKAHSCLEKAVVLSPNNPDIHRNIALVYSARGLYDEACRHLEKALSLAPDNELLLNMLGNEYLVQGMRNRARQCFSHALEVNAHNATAHSNLLLCLHYDPDITPEQLRTRHIHWASRHTATLPRLSHGFKGRITRKKRIRVGYVSPDFRQHPVASFIEALLSNHDSGHFDIHCYSDVESPDETSLRFSRFPVSWHETATVSDESLAEAIRGDGIDILVDLCGHMGRNRLTMFARKPAPVQVHYLGYPGTTGVAEMDYFLTDRICDPPGSEKWYTEKLLYVPGCFCCYSPSAPVSTGPTPVRDSPIIFGSFHHLARINEPVIELWTHVLEAVLESSLLIYRTVMTKTTAQRIIDEFVRRGIDAKRIIPMNRVPQEGWLAAYRSIDILLDTTPWSGHTTACEALWMGVPVVTLTGERHAGRMVTSILHAVGKPGWCASSADDFVRIAHDCAYNREHGAKDRFCLRERMVSSPLCDATGFVRRVETVLTALFQGL